jgi:prepilin-type N-terminal cleavage/methylation domain-containing protein
LAQGGFTLLEVLVAVAIVMILAAAIAPLVVGRLADARVESVHQDLDTLADGTRQFYQDTGKLPPVLEALVSLGVPYDDDFDGTVDEDAAACAQPCDPPGIDPRNYDGWKGAYIQGGFDTKTNPGLSDTWGTNYAYCFVETGFDVNGNGVADLICVSPTVNPNGTRRMDAWALDAGFRLCPKQQAEAVIASFGKDRSRNAILDGQQGTATPTPNANPLPQGQVVFDDNTTYTEYASAGVPEAYDGDGFLRLIFNDDDDVNTPPDGVVDGDCVFAETAGVGGVDEDDFDDVDNDADGRTDEDPPYGVRAGDLYRTITIADLTQDKVALTTERLDTLETAIKRFYRDTNRMPPTLPALISLSVEYDGDFDGAIAAGETIPAAEYPGWNGPYLTGSPDLTNPTFLDGWGNLIAMLVFVDRLTLPDPPGLPPENFTFTDPARNGAATPPGILYQAVLVSRGSDQEFTFSGSGTAASGAEIDNDGDGVVGEDALDGVDNDDDGRVDEDLPEDPPDAAEGPLDVPGTSDADSADPFRLVSIRDVDEALKARTREMLIQLNAAATDFTNVADANGVDDNLPPNSVIDELNEGISVLDEIVGNTLDDDSDASVDEDGEEFDYLKSLGYISGALGTDGWGRPFQWDDTNNQFYSQGVDGCDGDCPGGTPGTGDDL